MKSHRSYSDHEIARYVLGLDSPEHTQDIQARLAQDDAAAACALKWEAYFLGIVDALPPAPPPATVLAGIQATLGIEETPTDAAPTTGRPSHEAPETASDTATTPAPARPRCAWRFGRKQAVVASIVAVVIILVVLVLSASLHHTSSTVVQQTIDLDAQ
ncbi:hypothetical protein CCAE64S_03127 [Castellaniella caeni]